MIQSTKGCVGKTPSDRIGEKMTNSAEREGEMSEKCKLCLHRARWWNNLFKPIWFRNMYKQGWVCLLKDYGNKKDGFHRYLYCQCQNTHNQCEDFKRA